MYRKMRLIADKTSKHVHKEQIQFTLESRTRRSSEDEFEQQHKSYGTNVDKCCANAVSHLSCSNILVKYALRVSKRPRSSPNGSFFPYMARMYPFPADVIPRHPFSSCNMCNDTSEHPDNLIASSLIKCLSIKQSGCDY